MYETDSPIRAEIVKGVLAEKGITAVILNKKESVWHIHGKYEVMTSVDEVMQAITIITHEITF
ncbi:hypothetical protein ADIS_0748 [Lunatimonas lonarensis]|uniref:Uncharacterized protein n=1 Tax=Lunatimonas lonarensis TaxID=1232681 RepID=R7ZXG2_9BACT|nr:hypothetical protein ADIS_0748 [Lunatimonas lonarensis]